MALPLPDGFRYEEKAALPLPDGFRYEDEQPVATVAPTPPQSSLIRRSLGDASLGIIRGVAKLPNVAVGLADIATGGKTGKFIEDTTGYDFSAADKFYNPLLSPETQEAQAEVSQTFKDKDFVSGLGSAISHPSVIAQTVAESVPSMLAGAGIARLGINALGKIAPLVASRFAPLAVGAGEGAVTAGSIAEDIRTQNADRELSGKQALLSGLAGLGTMGIGAAGSKLASSGIGRKLGLADIDSIAAGIGGDAVDGTSPNIFKRAAAGAVQEGVLEELPQSMQEQALQNIAQGKPASEGIAESAGMGLLSGGIMGSGSSAVFGGGKQAPAKTEQAPPITQINHEEMAQAVNNTPAPAVTENAPKINTSVSAPLAENVMVKSLHPFEVVDNPIAEVPAPVAATPSAPIAPVEQAPIVDSNGEIADESPLTEWMKTLPFAKQRNLLRRMGEPGGMAIVNQQFLTAHPEYADVAPEVEQAPTLNNPAQTNYGQFAPQPTVMAQGNAPTLRGIGNNLTTTQEYAQHPEFIPQKGDTNGQVQGRNEEEITQVPAMPVSVSGLPEAQDVAVPEPTSTNFNTPTEVAVTAKQPWEMTKTEFVDFATLRNKEKAQYIDPDGGTIADSRTVPALQSDFPVGSWRKESSSWNKYGDTIEQLQEIDLNKVKGVEDTGSDRSVDVARYSQWIKEGKTPPPFRVAQLQDGTYQLSDGHRRLLALRNEGITKVKAWVALSGDTGLKDSAGKVIDTDLTHQLSIKQALSEGKTVPPEVLAEYPNLIAPERPRTPTTPMDGEKVAPAPKDEFIDRPSVYRMVTEKVTDKKDRESILKTLENNEQKLRKAGTIQGGAVGWNYVSDVENAIESHFSAKDAAKSKGKEERELMKRAEELSKTEGKVRDLWHSMTNIKSSMESVAAERGMYGVQWAEKNVGNRWYSLSQQHRAAKEKLLSAVKKIPITAPAKSAGVQSRQSVVEGVKSGKIKLKDFTKTKDGKFTSWSYDGETHAIVEGGLTTAQLIKTLESNLPPSTKESIPTLKPEIKSETVKVPNAKKFAAEKAKAAEVVAVYNGKEVVMDYVADPKRKFSVAAQRVRDNLAAGDRGYVKADGKIYEITRDKKTAKLIDAMPETVEYNGKSVPIWQVEQEIVRLERNLAGHAKSSGTGTNVYQSGKEKVEELKSLLIPESNKVDLIAEGNGLPTRAEIRAVFEPETVFSPEQAIKVAADDVYSLRPQDIFRVLSETPEVHRVEVARYIVAEHPANQRVHDEVRHSMKELTEGVKDTPTEVVQEAVKTAKKEGTSLKEQKKYLLENIEDAIKDAPDMVDVVTELRNKGLYVTNMSKEEMSYAAEKAAIKRGDPKAVLVNKMKSMSKVNKIVAAIENAHLFTEAEYLKYAVGTAQDYRTNNAYKERLKDETAKYRERVPPTTSKEGAKNVYNNNGDGVQNRPSANSKMHQANGFDGDGTKISDDQTTSNSKFSSTIPPHKFSSEYEVGSGVYFELTGKVDTTIGAAREKVLSQTASDVGATFTPVEVKGGNSAILREIAHKFGQRIVFFRSSNNNPDSGIIGGFTNRATPRTIYLNTDSHSTLYTVLGHEITHTIEYNNPSEYESLLANLFPYIDSDKYGAYARRLKRAELYQDGEVEDIYREFVSNAVGELFIQPEMWNHMARQNPSLFKRLADIVMELLSTVKKFMTDNNKAQPIFTDAAQANKIIANALEAYAQSKNNMLGSNAPSQYQSSMPLKSMADLKERLMFAPGIGHIMQALNKEGKTLNVLNKSINTMYHIAEKHPIFKPVYLAGQKFMSDIAAFTYKSEALAPSWFPKPKFTLDRNMVSNLIPTLNDADNLVVSQALADGTLENGPDTTSGVKWTDAQLKSKYNMTPVQVKLYHEAHAAIGESLDNAARSNLYVIQHKMKIDLADIADPRTANVAEYADAMNQYFDTQIDTLTGEIAEHKSNLADKLKDVTDPDEITAISAPIEKAIKQAQAQISTFTDAQKTVTAIDKTNTGMKNGGFYSLSRFGEYNVTVTQTLEDGTSKVELFTMYDSEMQARKAERDIKRAYKDEPSMSVVWQKMSKEDYKLFGGLNLDSLGLFAEHADPAHAELYQKYLDKVANNHSALKKFIHRKGIAGFSNDGARSIANFLYTNARLSSKNFNLGQMKEAANEIKDNKELRDLAINLHDYLTNPVEEFSRLRGVMFSWFIGGSLASGFTNLTQTVMMTAPYLAGLKYNGKQVSTREVTKHLMTAAKLALVPNAKMDQNSERTKALIWADMEGHTAPQDIHQMMAIAGNRMGASNPKWNLALKTWGGVFAITEIFNRRVSFIAAFDLAMANGQTAEQARSIAADAVDASQGVYNKANRPVMGRGLGAVVLTFKQYSIMYMELFSRVPMKQKLMMLGLLMLGGGAEGLPFEEDLTDLIDTIGQWLGYSTNSKRSMRNFAEEQLGKDLGALFTTGLSAYLPIDIQGRMSMGNLIPGTGILKQSSTDKMRDIKELVGPVGGLITQVGDLLELSAKGQVVQGVKAAMPRAVQVAVQGAEMIATGKATDKYGRKTFDATPVEGLEKMIGFNPTRIADEQQAKRGAMQDRELLKIRTEEVVARGAQAQMDNNSAEKQAARDQRDKWNAANPDLQITGLSQKIANRVKTMKATSRERYLKGLPKDQRKAVLSEMS